MNHDSLLNFINTLNISNNKSPPMVYSTVYFVSFQQDYILKTNMFSFKHQHSIAPTFNKIINFGESF